MSTDVVDQILFACLDRPEAEWEDAIAEACREHDDLASQIAGRFDSLRALGMARPDSAWPTRLGEYELIRPIGGGAMGAVFLARRRGETGDVALKILHSGLRFSESARRRFARELEMASGLQHPGICAVREAGEADGVPFLAMEFIDGESLASRIARATRSTLRR